jgi:ribonucleotide monophosphatase NagD (HAD superfamily)
MLFHPTRSRWRPLSGLLRFYPDLRLSAREAVMVGDDMDLDIRLSKRLGMKAFFILDGAGQSFSQKSVLEADSIVRNLNKAVDALTEL